MAVRNNFAAGEVLLAADLNDTFASKLDLAGGKILQITYGFDTSVRNTTSTSYLDANVAVSITPQKSNSVILVVATFIAQMIPVSATTDVWGNVRITDSSNNPLSGSEEGVVGLFRFTYTAGATTWHPMTLVGRSTPASTSQQDYKLRFKSGNANNTLRLRNDTQTARMYALEVSA